VQPSSPPAAERDVPDRPDAAPRWVNRGWLVAAGAALAWSLVALLRVWLPSLGHVPEDPGATVLARGVVATLWLVPAALVVLVLPRLGPRRLWRGGVAALVVGRIALQLTDGGRPQLVVAGLAVLGAALATVAFAAGSPSGHLARVGIVLGLGLEVVAHAALDTIDLAWRSGAGPLGTVVVTGLATVFVAERAARVPLWWPVPLDDRGELSPVWTRGAAWPWLGVGPAIALVGILVAPTARFEVATGLGPRGGMAVLAVATALALCAAAFAPALGARASGAAGAVLILAATAVAIDPEGLSSSIGQAGLLVGVGLVLGAPTAPGDEGPRRRGAAVVASLLLFLAVGVAYYGAHELPVPLDDDAVLLATAAVLAVLGAAAARDTRQLRPTRASRPWAAVATAGAIVVVGVLLSATVPVASEHEATGDLDGEVRVVTANVRAGFDGEGRFDPDAVADAIVASGADVVVLNEVDRGWLLEGGHDLLRLVADRAGMAATFAPAADELWGNAVLTRRSVEEATVTPLPRAGAAMRRSSATVVVDVGGGRSLALVATQLHEGADDAQVRLTQARAVTAEVARLRGRGLPVVVLGDLGADLDAPELEPLTILADAVPGGGQTWPADDPQVRRSHVLRSSDLVARDGAVLRTPTGDHLPVAVTLRLSGED
jgi:endonuclease/exonuclease/phosphatase family metal-dependent hydrolase